ncbi:Nuclear hormone receptor family member nhr-13 [Caenorhabditis elegans]|uniref:Isoform a of Nuclear hormone receptor family member nhr-13 n=3 Tax=Caenorhabditis elegans TaxID=6239 RepID=Q9N4Q7-2|nr:Nuclear hormone receptor family member nhr-13 [Caenorhabditis elegans]CCD67432.1 Nuclear hormone receptor family member nhr-13 [Caenorhabditis elegans]|eukprot:NP_001024268.1 Nuclear hormone receptor family member nhr-13 [Caenorhabditis elegans]
MPTNPNSCEVCSSSSNSSCNHFGARTCKACAAFFRRTVSMKLDYQCIDQPDACRVHCDSRVICRFCRLKKCHDIGMKPLLVKSKNERKNYIRISKGLIRKRSVLGDNVKENSEEIQNDDDPQESDAEMENESTPGPSSEPSENVSAENQETVTKFLKLEASMCDRRRLLYAETPISIVLESGKEWPYENAPLKMFDYKLSQGMSKHDFVMIMDYARGMPGFDEMNYADSVFCYRLVCAVDFVINSAYYTYKRGIEHNELVLSDGTFIPMVPTPLTGYEENANLLFQSQDDLMKFRTLMPLILHQWETCVPFAQLAPSHEEFCLLKAICVWHVSYYRLSEDGRRIAIAQRNRLIRALHHVCHLDSDDVGERFGNVMMALNYIMEQIRHVNCSFVMISIFGILKVDSLMLDVTSFW